MSELVLENEIAQVGFDYSGLENTVAVKAQIAASNIKLRLKRTVEDIIEIGRELKEIKPSLAGRFDAWFESETGLNRKMAYRFMQTCEKFGTGHNVTSLSPTVLYMLSSPSTPDSIVEKALTASESGAKITVDWVKREREMIDAIRREKGETQKYKSLWEQSLAAEEVQRGYANELKEKGGVETVEVVKEVVIEKIPDDYETLKANLNDSLNQIEKLKGDRESLVNEQAIAIAEAKRSQYKADKAARERDEQAIAEREKRIRELDRNKSELQKHIEELKTSYAAYSDKAKGLDVHLRQYKELRTAASFFWANFSGFGEPLDIELERKEAGELPNMLRGIAASIDIFLGNTVAIENKGTQNETVQAL